MKIWTYSEMLTKVKTDADLLEETFITPDEFVGYFNEALSEAEAEIVATHQDYFLTKYYIPSLIASSSYDLPANIYGNRIRGVIFKNGVDIYEIKQYRRKNKFIDIAFTEQFGSADFYRYYLQNDSSGQSKFVMLPASRETAILSPVASQYTPHIMWYIRNCARVAVVGEYCNPEIIATTQVSAANDTIQTYAGSTTLGVPSQGQPGSTPGSIAYVTGDAVKFLLVANSTVPAPLVAGTVYYAIQTGSGLIKLATSRANAIAGTAINLTTVGTGYHNMVVAATTAIQNATLIDIPEFATFIMQWVKCCALYKEKDPSLKEAQDKLNSQKLQMIDTLTQGIEDDDDFIQMDLSAYIDGYEGAF